MTPTDRPRRAIRWWQYAGPWPLSPTPVVLALLMASVFFEMARLTAIPAGVNPALYPGFILQAIPAAVATWVVLWAFARAQAAGRDSARFYWTAIAVTVVFFVGVRYAMGLVPREGYSSEGVVILAALLRTTIVVVFIQSVTGITSWRLGEQVAKTKAALRLVRQQQEHMLEADERTRAQVSMLLHDRVQAGLIAACLELLDASEQASPELRRDITDVVHRLEELRGLDVRSAARALSPNLVDSDLHSAVDDLAAQYLPAMRVAITVSPHVLALSTRPSRQVLLGVYRIIEQSLLNAAVHGRARNCAVAVTGDGDLLSLVIDDDGRGLQDGETGAGVGTGLIATWVRILDGSWSMGESPTGGVRVSASVAYAK